MDRSRLFFAMGLFVIMVFGVVGSAFADVNWKNTSGDGLWSNAANWEDNVTSAARVPTSADKTAIRTNSIARRVSKVSRTLNRCGIGAFELKQKCKVK